MYACTHTHTHIQQLARLFARILCSRIHIYILFRKEVHIEDEDEFVDPDGSDHDRDSPIGKVDLMLSDDESDICKFCQILCLVLGPSG